MLRIFGRKTSSNVQTVMWAVGELGLEHERIDVGGPFGGTDTAEFRAMNPNGLVPVIEDDGLVVFESNAITRYLAARHGAASGLWSDDPRVNAIGDMWMEWAKTTVYPVLIPGIFITLVRTPSKDRDPVRFEAQRKQLAAVMAIADGQLTLTVNNPDSGSATEELAVSYDRDPLEIGFNAKYLLDITNQLSGSDAVFMLADPGSPTLVRDTAGDDALYVLMPMRV